MTPQVFALEPELKLTTARCFQCNRFYGFERAHEARCPHCAHVDGMKQAEQIKKLERANAALRGCLSKMSKK